MDTHSRCARGLDWLRKDTLCALQKILEPSVIRLDELGNLLVDGWPRRAKLKPKANGGALGDTMISNYITNCFFRNLEHHEGRKEDGIFCFAVLAIVGIVYIRTPSSHSHSL